MRNPGRTASTAAALMIGLTLVSFVAVFGKGLLASDENALRKQLGTSHVITSQSGWDTVPLGAGEAASAAPGVALASSIRNDRASSSAAARSRRQRRRPGDDRPGLQLRVGRGLDGVARDAAARRRHRPRGRGPRRRASWSFLTPAGKRVTTVVRGVYRKHGDLDQLLGQVVLSQAGVRPQLPAAGRHADARAGRLDGRDSSGRSRRSPTRSSRRATSSSPTGRPG